MNRNDLILFIATVSAITPILLGWFYVDTHKKLENIHHIVNSNMTSAIKAELDATRRELILLLQIVELHKQLGKGEPSAEALTEIEVTKSRINELKAQLNDRLKAGDLSAANGTGK